MAEYTEDTFKKSKWTIFQNTTCRDKSVFDYVIIQAPRGVAEDVMRNGLDIDPNNIGCHVHGQTDFSVQEEIQEFSWLFKAPCHNKIFVISHDAVPYYAKGIFKEPVWIRPKE